MELARRVAIAIGGHHGVFPGSDQWYDLPASKLGYGADWDAARHRLLDQLAETYGLAD